MPAVTTNDKTIEYFGGRYHFLSNFSGAEVWYDGETYPSTEHAYQAAKTEDPQWRQWVRNAPTPYHARKLGNEAPKRADFEESKNKLMYELVRQKFRNHPNLAYKLIATGDAVLIEGNWWGDTYWGICNGRGANCLGKILMDVRAELLAKMEG